VDECEDADASITYVRYDSTAIAARRATGCGTVTVTQTSHHHQHHHRAASATVRFSGSRARPVKSRKTDLAPSVNIIASPASSQQQTRQRLSQARTQSQSQRPHSSVPSVSPWSTHDQPSSVDDHANDMMPSQMSERSNSVYRSSTSQTFIPSIMPPAPPSRPRSAQRHRPTIHQHNASDAAATSTAHPPPAIPVIPIPSGYSSSTRNIHRSSRSSMSSSDHGFTDSDRSEVSEQLMCEDGTESENEHDGRQEGRHGRKAEHQNLDSDSSANDSDAEAENHRHDASSITRSSHSSFHDHDQSEEKEATFDTALLNAAFRPNSKQVDPATFKLSHRLIWEKLYGLNGTEGAQSHVHRESTSPSKEKPHRRPKPRSTPRPPSPPAASDPPRRPTVRPPRIPRLRFSVRDGVVLVNGDGKDDKLSNRSGHARASIEGVKGQALQSVHSSGAATARPSAATPTLIVSGASSTSNATPHSARPLSNTGSRTSRTQAKASGITPSIQTARDTRLAMGLSVVERTSAGVDQTSDHAYVTTEQIAAINSLSAAATSETLDAGSEPFTAVLSARRQAVEQDRKRREQMVMAAMSRRGRQALRLDENDHVLRKHAPPSVPASPRKPATARLSTSTHDSAFASPPLPSRQPFPQAPAQTALHEVAQSMQFLSISSSSSARNHDHSRHPHRSTTQSASNQSQLLSWRGSTRVWLSTRGHDVDRVITAAQLAELRMLYETLDEDCSDSLDADEIAVALRVCGVFRGKEQSCKVLAETILDWMENRRIDVPGAWTASKHEQHGPRTTSATKRGGVVGNRKQKQENKASASEVESITARPLSARLAAQIALATSGSSTTRSSSGAASGTFNPTSHSSQQPSSSSSNNNNNNARTLSFSQFIYVVMHYDLPIGSRAGTQMYAGDGGSSSGSQASGGSGGSRRRTRPLFSVLMDGAGVGPDARAGSGAGSGGSVGVRTFSQAVREFRRQRMFERIKAVRPAPAVAALAPAPAPADTYSDSEANDAPIMARRHSQ